MNKVLITGVSGEIGFGLVKMLAKEKKFEVVAIDIKKPSKEISKYINCFYLSDILDYKKLDSIFKKENFDSVIHLASILSTGGEKNPDLAVDVNILGTLNLLKLSNIYGQINKKSIKFLFPSSIAAHGDPITVYGISKKACEDLGKYYSKYYKLLDKTLKRKFLIDFRSVRFPGLLSPDTLPSGGTSDYGPEMLHAAAQNVSYECFVRPDTTIPFMAMADATNILYKLLLTPKSKLTQTVYEISGFSVSAKEIEKEIRNAFKSLKVTYKINQERQKIVDSWPKKVGSKEAIKDWGYKLEYDFKRTFSTYLIPKVRQRYSKN